MSVKTAAKSRVKSAAKRYLAKTPSKAGNEQVKAGKKTKMVFYFGGGKADGNGTMKPLLGGKGANLAQMCLIGLPVPGGFTITTEVCNAFYAAGKKLPPGLIEEVQQNIAKLEKETGKKFGDPKNPLLVAV